MPVSLDRPPNLENAPLSFRGQSDEPVRRNTIPAAAATRGGRIARPALMVTALALMIVATWTAMALAPTDPLTPSAPRPNLSRVQGDRTLTLSVGTGPRTALVHHPDSAAAGAALVVVLHGETGSAKQARDDYGWNALADRDGFVVAYPDSVGNTWNLSPSCCGQAHADHLNDLGFLHQLVSAIGKADLIARNRVFAVGFSDGATLAYTWACSLPGELAGIGPVAGSLAVGCPIVAPVSLAAIRGTADHTVLLAGTSRAHNPSTTALPAPPPSRATQPSPSLEATLALFRALDGCPTEPEATTVLPVTQRSWTCVATRTVSAAVINDGGHQWPGANAATHPDAPADDPSWSALNATDWLWTHLRDSRSR